MIIDAISSSIDIEGNILHTGTFHLHGNESFSIFFIYFISR